VQLAPRRRIPALAAAVILLAAGAGAAGATATPAAARTSPVQAAAPQATFKAPAIRHVWVIVLENESFGFTFGAGGKKEAPFLARTLPSRGALLTQYFGIGHHSLDNYIALASGQAPDVQTGKDCKTFSDFTVAQQGPFTGVTKFGQVPGDGCVYPASVKTVANQLSGRGLSWKSYQQQMGVNPARDGTTSTSHGPACGHPPVGSPDLTQVQHPANDNYATRHNPFVYFHSVIDSQSFCNAHVVTLTPLTRDLKHTATTPNYSFITPGTCADGHDETCTNGQEGGLVQANAFLKTWIPRITSSPAYKSNGLIVITFDESESLSASTACCGEKVSTGHSDPSHPNADKPGLQGPGGGRIGAVLLSPFIRPGTHSTVAYNQYSLLRTVEDLFGLSHLGDARQPQVHSFGRDVYTRPHR
jgi:phosphatidylinositol-3-phosphatase